MTYLPHTPHLSALVLVAPVALVTLVVLIAANIKFATIMRTDPRFRWSRMAGLLRMASPRRRAVVIAAFVMFWLPVLHGALGMGGGTAYVEDGKYFMKSHGAVTEVTKAIYLRNVVSTERALLGFVGSMAVVSSFMAFLKIGHPGEARDD